jgi:hypothetical protein
MTPCGFLIFHKRVKPLFLPQIVLQEGIAMTIQKMELPVGVAAIYNKEADSPFMIVSVNCTKGERHLIEVVKKSVISKGIIYAN